MSKTLSELLKDCSTFTTTENGMVARSTTKSAVLDLFSVIGAIRNRSEREIISKFVDAMREDVSLAMKTLFYARDIREGLGERKVFRVILSHLSKNFPALVSRNLCMIPEFGRWDDLYCIVDSTGSKSLKSEVFKLIETQLKEDLENKKESKPVSLLAKWLKSENTSSYNSKKLASITRKFLGLTSKEYRKMLSSLREYIDVTECKMSSKDWDKIKYESVPSKAMSTYRKAFERNDRYRFSEFLELVKNGKAKINSATMVPSDFFRAYKDNWGYVDDVLELQWKNLPDFIKDDISVIPVSDVSGSMISNDGLPMSNSVGLGTYLAERNKGPYKDLLITFSNKPSVIDISKCDTLHDKFRKVFKSDWGYNTDVEAVFNLILKLAVESNLKKEDMAKSIVVISDMEFDSGASALREDFTTYMRKKFNSHGYDLPILVYWNVNSRNDVVHAHKEAENVVLVSGCSPTVFSKVLGLSRGITPYQMMMDILSSERYKNIN